MFAKPQRVSIPTAAKPARGSSSAKPSDTIPGWKEICAIDACMKRLEGILKLRKIAGQDAAGEILKERGLGARGKPESLSLAEGDARGSAYIRRRDTRSALSLEEVGQIALIVGQSETDPDTGEICGVPGFTETLDEQPAILAVNPDHAGNELLLKKLDKILAPHIAKGEVPADFIVEMTGARKTIISEQALGSMFHLGDAEKIEQLYPLVVGGVTLRPVFKDLDKAWEIVKPLLAGEDAEPAPAVVAAEKKAAKDTITAALKASLAEEAA